ncbi:MAG: hypothetical protein KIS67_00935 [Verrucomicrobiae bacterium]|nr:hypothetical protein [Verrucomicrobiae bacterium]
MSQTEQALLDTLIELEAAARSIRTADPKPDLRALFRRIDELTVQLPSDAPADLRHYLQRKSYEKARQFLEGRESENRRGSCAH